LSLTLLHFIGLAGLLSATVAMHAFMFWPYLKKLEQYVGLVPGSVIKTAGRIWLWALPFVALYLLVLLLFHGHTLLMLGVAALVGLAHLLTEYKWLLTERERVFFMSKLRPGRGNGDGFQVRPTERPDREPGASLGGSKGMDDSVGTPATSLNVFLAHSPFQYFVACHMIVSIPEYRSARNCLVVDRVWGGQEPDQGPWSDLVDLMPPVGGSVLGAGRRMRGALGRIIALVRTADLVRLFVTNVQWPLNNVVLTAVTAESSRRSVEVCNYPEGLGSLRLVYPTSGQRWRDMMKGTLGLFGGVAYRPIKYDLMGLEGCDLIYSFWPHLLPDRLRGKAVAIPRSRHYRPRSNFTPASFLDRTIALSQQPCVSRRPQRPQPTAANCRMIGFFTNRTITASRRPSGALFWKPGLRK